MKPIEKDDTEYDEVYFRASEVLSEFEDMRREIAALKAQPVQPAPLTDEQLWALWNSQGTDYMNQQEAVVFARAIEAALAAPPTRPDGMPTSKTERTLRRMLCAQRHGSTAYMDDGEASWGGDNYQRITDYMRETPEQIQQAWVDAVRKKPVLAQPVQPAPLTDSARQAIALAYGHLWHINNEPLAPIPLRSEESASYAARKLLRDLLTHEERGSAINAVRELLGRTGGAG